MATEVEAKFLAESPQPLDELATATRLGRARLGPATTSDEVDLYLDTDAAALAAAGWACRLRHRGDSVVVSMKGEHRGRSRPSVHRRAELEGPATASLDPDTWPMSEARELLDQLRDGRPLVQRVRLDQRRTTRSLHDDGGQIATLSLDRVSVRGSGAAVATLFTVELELEPSAHERTANFEAAVAALERHPGLAADPLTKLEHALQLAAAW
jgi:inorganic triphosphatase YgiF